MANTPTIPNSGNTSLDAILKLLGPAYQSNFQSIANAPVDGTTPLQNYQNAQNYYSKSNAAIGQDLQNKMQNGVNGIPFNPTQSASAYVNGIGQDTALTSGLLRDMITGAVGMTNNGVNAGVTSQGDLLQNQVQNRDITDKYGGNDPLLTGNGDGSLSPVDAKNAVIKQGGLDLFEGLDDASKYRLAQDIIKQGGVAAYRAKNPSASHFTPGETQLVTNLNHGLTMAYQAQDRLQTSKALQDALQNPLKKQFVRAFLATGQTGLLSGLQLSDEDVNALRNMEALNNTSIAGQAKVKLGVDSNPGQNLDYLKQMTDLMGNEMDAFKQHKGFGKVTDIPGFKAKPPLSSFNK